MSKKISNKEDFSKLLMWLVSIFLAIILFLIGYISKGVTIEKKVETAIDLVRKEFDRQNEINKDKQEINSLEMKLAKIAGEAGLTKAHADESIAFDKNFQESSESKDSSNGKTIDDMIKKRTDMIKQLGDLNKQIEQRSKKSNENW